MTRMQGMFMAIYVVVAILSSVTSEINTQIPLSDVKIIVTQPVMKPPQVALAGRRRPILKPKPKPKPDGIVKSRPPHHKVVISPVMTPIPIYHIVVHHQHHKPVHIPKESCVKSTGESISSFCQALAARDFYPTSQNTTWETCCAAYIELDCYRQYAGQYCFKAERKALVDYSNNVANYFNSTICRAVAYRNWHYSCNRDTHLEE